MVLIRGRIVTEQTTEWPTQEDRADYLWEDWKALAERLRADAERLKAERDSWKVQMQEWMEGSAQLQVKLDEAVEKLQLEHSRAGSSHVPPLPGTTDYACDVCRFLAFLDVPVRQDVQGEAPPCEKVSVCCGAPKQAQAFVGAMCGKCYRRADFKCATHGGPFPDGGNRCTAALTENVTR